MKKQPQAATDVDILTTKLLEKEEELQLVVEVSKSLHEEKLKLEQKYKEQKEIEDILVSELKKMKYDHQVLIEQKQQSNKKLIAWQAANKRQKQSFNQLLEEKELLVDEVKELHTELEELYQREELLEEELTKNNLISPAITPHSAKRRQSSILYLNSNKNSPMSNNVLSTPKTPTNAFSFDSRSHDDHDLDMNSNIDSNNSNPISIMDRIKELKKELNSSKKYAQKLESERAILTEEIKEIRSKYQDATANVDDLQKNLALAAQDYRRLKLELNQLKNVTNKTTDDSTTVEDNNEASKESEIEIKNDNSDVKTTEQRFDSSPASSTDNKQNKSSALSQLVPWILFLLSLLCNILMMCRWKSDRGEL